MVKINVTGGSTFQRSLPFDAQRSINLFPVIDQFGKEPASLYGTPGRNLFALAGNGPGRNCFNATNGRAFAVSGFYLYELMSDGSTIVRGTVDRSPNIVTMDENGTQLAICDQQNLYIFTYATNAFVKVNSPNLPSAFSVTFIGGYFVVNEVNSGIFHISKLYDGTTWAALDFATAESSPDNLRRVLNVSGRLWLFGDYTTEIWSNTGALAFPFESNGATIQVGILAPFSAIALDNSVFWLGQDQNGRGIVYRAQGYTPQVISTETQGLKIQAGTTPATFRSWAYQEAGHTFYTLTGGGMETSLVYDLTTQIWHERAFLNENGSYELDTPSCGMQAFNRYLTLDRRNGNICEQRMDFYSDNGDEIVRDRVFTHLSQDNVRIQYHNLTIGFETGVGISTGQGSDPEATLFISNDGGKTWPIERRKKIGKIGDYLRRVTFERLGQARIRTFRFRVTDPIAVRITGGYLNEQG